MAAVKASQFAAQLNVMMTTPSKPSSFPNSPNLNINGDNNNAKPAPLISSHLTSSTISEKEVFYKCIDEIEVFADQRIPQYFNTLQDVLNSNKRKGELQRVMSDSKTKTQVKNQAKDEYDRLQQQISQTDITIPNPEAFVEIFQKIRLAVMLFTRLEKELSKSSPLEALVTAFADRAVLIAAKCNVLHPPPFAVINSVDTPRFTREDVRFAINLIEKKGEPGRNIWKQLNDNWKVPVEDWQGELSFYKPVFENSPEPIVLSFLDPANIRHQKPPNRPQGFIVGGAGKQRPESHVMLRSISDNDEMTQFTFKSRLVKEARWYGAAIRTFDSRHDAFEDFHAKQGEILEVLNKVGTDELRVRNAEGMVGIVDSSLIAQTSPGTECMSHLEHVSKKPARKVHEQRTLTNESVQHVRWYRQTDVRIRSNSETTNTAAVLPKSRRHRYMKEQNDSKVGKILQNYKALKNGEVSVEAGEIVEILQHGPNGQTRVVTNGGMTGDIPTRIIRGRNATSRRDAEPNDFGYKSEDSDLTDDEDRFYFTKMPERRLNIYNQREFLELLERTSAKALKVKIAFEAMKPKELSIYPGEIVEYIDDHNSDSMILVRAADGKSGYVPRANVIDLHSPSTATAAANNLKTSPTGAQPSGSGNEFDEAVGGVSRRKTNYIDLEKIGAGSYGNAVLATRITDGKQVVIKEVELDDENRDKIRAEAILLAKYPHKCIVKFMGFFEENGKLYIETQYCARGNLRRAINKRLSEPGGKFTEHEIRKWMGQVALALQHLHDLGVIHRDVKAENVFITNDGDVKLGDLGAATELNKTLKQLQCNTFAGTLPYMAPEIFSGQPYDSKVDIWSLGVLTYFLAALHLPFGDDLAIYNKIMSNTRPPALPNSCSRDLVRFVDALLTYDAADRPDIKQVLAERFLQMGDHKIMMDSHYNAKPLFLPPAIQKDKSSAHLF